MDSFIGEIRAFPYAFTPQGWIVCDGSQLAVAPYAALYAVIGNAFGGTPNQTFNLPDLRGCAPAHQGALPDQSLTLFYAHGYGEESVTLTEATTPMHTHAFQAAMDNPALRTAAPDPTAMVTYPYVVQPPNGYMSWLKGSLPNVAMSATMITPCCGSAQGTSVSHENRQPCLVFKLCICFDGVFPVRP